MKTISWLVIISFAIFSPSVYADNSDKQIQQKRNTGMVRSEKQAKFSGSQSAAKFTGNDGPKIGGGRGNTPKDIPGRNSNYMGWQGGPGTVQTGRGSSSGSTTNQGGRQMPSGPSWMKKQDDKKKGSVADFGREAQLKNLADPTSRLTDAQGNPIDLGGDKLKDRPRGKAGLTGGDGTIEVGRVTVNPGDGKNQSSRREQQSDGGTAGSDDEDIYDSGGNYMGKRGELTKDLDGQMWGNMDASQRESYQKENEEFQRAGIKTQEEAKQMQEQQEAEMRGGVKSKEEAEAMQKQQEAEMKHQEQTKNAGDYVAPPAGDDDTVAKPNPDAVDESHLPWYLKGKKKQKSPEEVKA